MLFQGIEHTGIASPDPKRLTDWYVEHLGFAVNYVYDGNYFVKAPNGTVLEIFPSEGAAAGAERRTPGLRHLAIWVDNFDAAHAELKRQGVNLLGEPLKLQENRLLFFTDCDGNLLHLIHRPRPLP